MSRGYFLFFYFKHLRIVLHGIHTNGVLLYFLQGPDRGSGARDGGCVGDMQVKSSPSDGVGILGGPFSKGGVDDPAYFVVL